MPRYSVEGTDQSFDTLPDPLQFPGRVIKDTQTGQRFLSRPAQGITSTDLFQFGTQPQETQQASGQYLAPPVYNQENPLIRGVPNWVRAPLAMSTAGLSTAALPIQSNTLSDLASGIGGTVAAQLLSKGFQPGLLKELMQGQFFPNVMQKWVQRAAVNVGKRAAQGVAMDRLAFPILRIIGSESPLAGVLGTAILFGGGFLAGDVLEQMIGQHIPPTQINYWKAAKAQVINTLFQAAIPAFGMWKAGRNTELQRLAGLGRGAQESVGQAAGAPMPNPIWGMTQERTPGGMPRTTPPVTPPFQATEQAAAEQGGGVLHYGELPPTRPIGTEVLPTSKRVPTGTVPSTGKAPPVAAAMPKKVSRAKATKPPSKQEVAVAEQSAGRGIDFTTQEGWLAIRSELGRDPEKIMGVVGVIAKEGTPAMKKSVWKTLSTLLDAWGMQDRAEELRSLLLGKP